MQPADAGLFVWSQVSADNTNEELIIVYMKYNFILANGIQL